MMVCMCLKGMQIICDVCVCVCVGGWGHGMV